ncbi:uncharacterized protein LOC133564329 isoform X2 [Nerophis ophidion]|uniref:uncharacterized protein LOC133564329 isoform X2 n=1 Tax=Nerophis ophidion TaxID=159077 RepID=UPI002ADFF1A4|nr:uncharacterized protein LOC133564329 isoform X2 [Nerophis ophidion]
MTTTTRYMATREVGGRRHRLCFDGNVNNYELWEAKFLGHLRLLGLKATVLRKPQDGSEDDAVLREPQDGIEDDAKKNEDAYAELTNVLDHRSLSLVMREAADDGRKALRILREHYVGKGNERVIRLYMKLTSLRKAASESVSDYLLRAQTLITDLHNAEGTLSDALLISVILKGLPDTFKPLDLYVRQSGATMTFGEFKVALRTYDCTVASGGGKPASRRGPAGPRILPSHAEANQTVHVSVFKKNRIPQVTRCTVCCTKHHCPICPTSMYKPRCKAKLLQHMEVHVKNAIQHEEFLITKCHKPCKSGNSSHFHCPFCIKTTIKRKDAMRHLKLCRPPHRDAELEPDADMVNTSQTGMQRS